MSKSKNEVIEEQIMDAAVEAANKAAEKAKTGKRTLVDACDYWDFENYDTFVGSFRDNKFDATGKLIGYVMAQENGERFIISNSYSITKALEMVSYDPGAILEIIFKGKIEVKSTGKPFNKFEINLL